MFSKNEYTIVPIGGIGLERAIAETIKRSLVPIGGIIEELANKGRNKDTVEEKVNQLSDELKNALTEIKKNEDGLAIIIDNYKLELQEASLKEAETQERLKDSRSKRNELQAEGERLISKFCELEKQSMSLRQDIEDARREKHREEQKRQKAVVNSLIPFGNIIGAIESGDPKQLLPGYAQGETLVSLIEQKAENLQRKIALKESEMSKLHNQLSQNEEKMHACSKRIEEQEIMHRKLSTSITNIESNIKTVGKLLTDIGNLKENLGHMDTKTQRMLQEVSLLKDIGVMGHEMFEDLIPLNKEMFQLSKSISDSICSLNRKYPNT